MLGIGRASEYAGWWNGNAPPAFVSATTTTMAAAGKFPGATSIIMANGSWNSPDSDGSNATPFTFDSSGLVNSPNYALAVTYQVGSSSGYTFSGSPVAYMQSGNGSFVNLIAPSFNATTGALWNPYLTIGIGNGTSGTTNITGYICSYGNPCNFAFPVQWNSYTNQFLTIVTCGSTTSATFAGYSHNTALYGAAPTGSNLIYNRAVLANATTGAVIATNDRTATSGTPVDYADYTWDWSYFNSGSNAWAYEQISAANPVSSVSPDTALNNFYVASTWLAQSQTFDPTSSNNYINLCGQNLPATVAGAKAWFNFSSFGDTTILNIPNATTYAVLKNSANISSGRAQQANNYAYTNVVTTVYSPATSTTVTP